MTLVVHEIEAATVAEEDALLVGQLLVGATEPQTDIALRRVDGGVGHVVLAQLHRHVADDIGRSGDGRLAIGHGRLFAFGDVGLTGGLNNIIGVGLHDRLVGVEVQEFEVHLCVVALGDAFVTGQEGAFAEGIEHLTTRETERHHDGVPLVEHERTLEGQQGMVGGDGRKRGAVLAQGKPLRDDESHLPDVSDGQLLAVEGQLVALLVEHERLGGGDGVVRGSAVGRGDDKIARRLKRG